MTFSGILSNIYMATGRPADDIAQIAKLAVNLACEELHRTAELTYSYQLLSVTYPASAVTLAFSKILTDEALNVLSIHQVTTSDNKVIRLVDYPSLWAEIRKEQSLTLETAPVCIGKEPRWASVIGTSLMLFPAPAATTELTVTAKLVLPTLTGDNDTNYLLTYVPSVVLAKALVSVALQLKDGELYELYSKDAERVTSSLAAWNSSLSKDNLEGN